jgi:endonuclease/exonuclease/phosphatase family metal-dependent hydrolase
MTRILSYNILVGGGRRIDSIERMLRAADPDVIGLVEATNQDVVKELARRLDMEYRINLSPDGAWRPSLALLSRLPIVSSTVHAHPKLRPRSLLEVTLQEEHGERLTAFVTHLSASFAHRRGGDYLRRAEIVHILQIMRANHGPHVLMGDFNSLAPGDRLQASHLLRYLIELDQRSASDPHFAHGQPSLDFVVPSKVHFLNPLLRQIVRSNLLCGLFDEAGSLYVSRGAIASLKKAGYVDCFRYVNPRSWGFTCPSAAPAGRIDYIFANPLLATRLSGCKVVNGGEDVRGEDASDHLPVMVDFAVDVATTFRIRLESPIEAEEAVGDAF